MFIDKNDLLKVLTYLYSKSSNANMKKAIMEVSDYFEQKGIVEECTADILNKLEQIFEGQEEILGQHAEHQHTLNQVLVFCRIIAGRTEEISPERQRDLQKSYLNSLVAATDRIDIKGIYSQSGASRRAIYFPIEEMYTPLTTIGPNAGLDRVPLVTLLSKHRRLLFVGGPGSGKTTFLRLIACVLSLDVLHGGEDGYVTSRDIHLGLPVKTPAPVPIFVRLASLVPLVAGGTLTPGAGWQILAAHLGASYGPDMAMLLIDHLDKGTCALLLDGLDEVADLGHRDRITQIVDAVMARWGRHYVLVTSRPFGYQGVSELKDVETVTIDAFRNSEIREFLSRWVRALFPNVIDPRSDPYLRELEEAIVGVRTIRRMARNPVMLTCLCVVHWNERKLPEGKADLLAAVLRWLLSAREDNRRVRGYTNTFAEECFKSLAAAMTLHPKGKQSIVDLDWAAAQLGDPYRFERDVMDPDQVRRDGRRFLEEEMLDSGIVECIGPGQLRFWHLTFQEHYAARALVDRSDGNNKDGWWHVIRIHLHDRQWWEVLDHFAGCLAYTGRMRTRTLVERVLSTADLSDLGSTAEAVGALGRLLKILEVYDFRPTSDLGWQEARDQVMAVFTEEGATLVNPIQRNEAATALGRAGDPRFDPSAWHLPYGPTRGFVSVPAGPFLMGTDPKKDPRGHVEELPQHEVDLPHFYIARYPVTVAQYRSFCEEASYEPENPGCLEGPDNHPVVEVSWHEALQYCQWLDGRLQKLAPASMSDLDSAEYTFWESIGLGRMGVTLPSEAEWEKAARGTDGRIYPWGSSPASNLANYISTKIGGTSSVGCFPGGKSPYGALDMSGNVWEWTRSIWDGFYPYLTGKTSEDLAASNEKRRVQRGGSFQWDTINVRCAYRSDLRPYPASRNFDGFGFRVALSPFVSSP